MAATAGIAMFASAGFSAASQANAGKFNSRVNEINAQFAEDQALDAERRGRDDEEQLRLRIRQAIGTARAGYAGQGVDVSVGSAADAQAGIAYQGEKDAITIRNNAAREAWGYRVQGWNYKTQAKLDKYKGYAGAVSTVLGAAGNYYSIKGGGSKGVF